MTDLHLDPAIAQPDCTLQQQPDAARQQHVFLRENPVGERFFGIVGAHGNHRLADDGATIDLVRDEVHGRAVNPYSARQRLAVRRKSGERRQQRRMDIDQPPGVMGDEAVRQHAHESGQHNECGLMRIDRLHQRRVEGITRGEVAVLEHLRRHTCGFGLDEAGSLRPIADHGGDAGVERLRPAFSARRGEQRFEVAAAPGYQADDVLHQAAHSTQGAAFFREIKEFPAPADKLATV